MCRSTLFLALSLAAAPLFANSITTDPAPPTSATPVTIRITAKAICGDPSVAREGNTFAVTLPNCVADPLPHSYAVNVGQLPPDDYDVTVAGAPVGPAGFFVRDANATLRIIGGSVGPTRGLTIVTIDAPYTTSCTAATCPPPSVAFNGVPAPHVSVRQDGKLIVVTPPNPKGIANVVVTSGNIVTSGYVFRYYDPAETPRPSMFERVLVPVFAFGPGAFGSSWESGLLVFNASDADAPLFSNSPIPAHTSPLLGMNSHAGGALVFTSREMSDSIRFNLRVFDQARLDEDAGTDVPVVRDSAFRTNDFSLLALPTDPRFRLTLRIFGVDNIAAPVTVTATGNDLQTIVTRSVPLESGAPCSRSEQCFSEPAHAVLDPIALFPEMVGQGLFRIDISPNGLRTWAMASITNNQTQHVTIVTPH